MYLNGIVISADPAIAGRTPPGFVTAFHRQSCCIVEFFRALIHRQLKTPDISSIAFLFTDLITTVPSYDRPLPYLRLPWPFDFAQYISSSDESRKHQIFDATRRAMLWLSEIEGWPAKPIIKSADAMLDANLRYQGVGKKSWISPDKMIRARVSFEFDLDYVILSAVFSRNRTPEIIGQKVLGRATPETDCLHYLLQEASWVSNRTFELRSSGYWQNSWTAEVP